MKKTKKTKTKKRWSDQEFRGDTKLELLLTRSKAWRPVHETTPGVRFKQ
jgi:hypothetical protein